jgi:serine/threonine protein kinase
VDQVSLIQINRRALLELKLSHMTSSFIGKVVDNYRIIENLGIGGMGVVFKAIHVKLDKLFALKMIAPGLAMNENFIKRFQTEAKSLAKFEDPNIVRIYDLREHNDQWFIVMEYVEGVNLLDIIRKKGAFPLQNALKILKQILTAIGHAHSVGIIHRDLKPNNVMISTDGKVKITDFGLAKDQTNMTTTLSVTSGGTLYYMSPEHVKGFQFTDKRSDIYSIGMTFYEMITGTVPFKDLQSDFDIRESIIRKDIIKPTVYNEKIPPELESIVMKSIAKKAEDRYQSTEEMLKAVIDFEDQDPNIDSKFALMEISEASNGKLDKKATIKVPPFISKIIFPMKQKMWTRVGIFGSLITVILLLFFLFKPSSQEENKIDELVEVSHLSFFSQPDAALIIIGKDTIGQTPFEHYSLQSGEYSLKISKNNYRSVDTTISLKPGSTLNLSFSLKPAEENNSVKKSEIKSTPETNIPVKTPLYALVTIKSEPIGADVLINGQLKGKTPLNLSDIQPDNYHLKIKKEGFEDYKKQIRFSSGRNNVLMAKLMPVSGGIQLNSEPPSALIILDGDILSETKTPAKLDKIPIGKHQLELKKKGYAPAKREIEVKKDEITKTKIELKRLEGRLSIQVRPWGSIFIDDALKKESADTKYQLTLPVERYKVTVTHPTLGRWERMVDIKPDKESEIVVNFNRKIPINVSAFDENGLPLIAEIFINGQDTGEVTPAEIKINVGIHKLSVKKEGYSSLSDEKEIFVDKGLENQHKIILKKND